MTRPISKLIAAALLALAVLGSQAAKAEPMKCSGEEKTCAASCKTAARTAITVCVTACGARLSACMKTGCWDDGVRRYCGLGKS